MQITNKVTILGVGISQTTLENAVKTVEKWLSPAYVIASHVRLTRTWRGNLPLFIVTPNPEMLVLASQDKQFKHILNSSDLTIPDGIGLVWASFQFSIFNFQLKERVAGTDLMLALCDLAAKKGYTVGLLGAEEGVVEKTAEVLRKRFPKIKIAFSVSNLGDLSNLGNLEAFCCDLLFVAFGAPKQEEFIYNLRINELKNSRIKVAMGVGGAFDLISGKLKRAPKIWQDLGFEWLWRLIQEPRRLKRIFNATIVFPYLVFKECYFSKLLK